MYLPTTINLQWVHASYVLFEVFEEPPRAETWRLTINSELVEFCEYNQPE